MTILGSLTLYSDRAVPELSAPSLLGLQRREGQHVNGRYNGSYREYFDVQPIEVLVPQRYKHMTVLASDNVRQDLSEALSTLDSKYQNSRQVFKLQKLMDQMGGSWHSVVNVSNTGANGEAVSGAFYLMASNQPIHVALMFDSLSGSVQLVWSTFDLKQALREQGILNYSFIAFSTLRDRPLFVPSQALCSKWWRMQQTFESQRYSTVKAANAIEVMLYKNPYI